MAEALSQIGVTGLAVMGANLARNIARHGVPVAVHNRTAARTRDFMEEHGHEGAFTAAESSRSSSPRSSGRAGSSSWSRPGAPVDGVIDELVPLLDKGDIIIDAGNSHFVDTGGATAELRRARAALHRHRRLRRRGGRAARAEHHARRRPPRPTARSRRSSPRSPRRSTASRAAPTSARTAPATT